MRVIKRYSNRRLYDTETSRTITQFDLARLIESGEQVQVVDARSGADVSAAVLGRILVSESERWGTVTETKELLRSLIQTGGEKSMSVLRNTVLASIGAFQVTKAKAEKIIDDLIKKGELNKSDRKKAVLELLDKAEKSTAKFREKVLKEAEKAQEGVGKVTKSLTFVRQDEYKKLERKVNRLAKQVKDLTAQVEARQ